MNKLLFFTATDNGYEDFIPLYVYFASKYNKDAQFEFLIKNLTPDFQNLINEFSKTFHINVKLRKLINEHNTADKLRFLTEPEIKCEYTYIGDIDIFITEDILPFHLNELKKYGTIYDNKIRLKYHFLMSGLHFVKTKEWYEKTKNVRNKYLNKTVPQRDEQILKNIVFESKIKVLDNIKENSFNRPIHGIHISLNRVPFTNKLTFPINDFKNIFINDLYKSDDWNKLKPFLSKKLLDILKKCEDYVNNQ